MFELSGAGTPLSKNPQTSDFSADSKSDILWQNTDGQADIWLMNGTTPVTEAAVGANPGPSWQVIGSGDFYGSLYSDILWQNLNGAVAIWEMNGTKVIASAVVGNPGSSWHIVGIGDFNGDGKSDILWQNTDGQAAIWLMNGTTPTNEAAVGANPGSSWHVIGTGDFNGDGKSDILWQNTDGQAAIWLMNGDHRHQRGAGRGEPRVELARHRHRRLQRRRQVRHPVAEHQRPGRYLADERHHRDQPRRCVGANPGSSWHIIGTGDFNGDGKSDILWQNTNGAVCDLGDERHQGDRDRQPGQPRAELARDRRMTAATGRTCVARGVQPESVKRKASFRSTAP